MNGKERSNEKMRGSELSGEDRDWQIDRVIISLGVVEKVKAI